MCELYKITGASSGIGQGTPKLLAANGVKVGLAARRKGKLESLLEDIRSQGGDGIVIQMDVTDQRPSTREVTFLTPDDIAHSVLYALQAPDHVNVSEVFILPTEQAW